MKLLLIEDDAKLAQNTKLFLENANFVVDAVAYGRIGLLRAKDQDYALIILDWMLPDIQGIEVLRELRHDGVKTPVIMTTAKGQVEDKLEGFSKGIDDYLVKPFALPELLARVNAIVRRTTVGTTDELLEVGKLKVNLSSCEVTYGEEKVELTPKEYAILELLIMKRGSVVSRDQILHNVWKDDVDLFTNHVEVHIKNLRQKVDKRFNLSLIKTVKGKGYILESV